MASRKQSTKTKPEVSKNGPRRSQRDGHCLVALDGKLHALNKTAADMIRQWLQFPVKPASATDEKKRPLCQAVDHLYVAASEMERLACMLEGLQCIFDTVDQSNESLPSNLCWAVQYTVDHAGEILRKHARQQQEAVETIRKALESAAEL